MTDDLVTRGRKLGAAAMDPLKVADPLEQYAIQAADRIEQDAVTIARLTGERDAMFRRAHLAEEWRDHDKERAEAAEATAARLRAELDEARGALRLLHGAVCGDTGFAACVRIDAGRAYPWPALDVAEEAAAAILAKIDGGQ